MQKVKKRSAKGARRVCGAPETSKFEIKNKEVENDFGNNNLFLICLAV